MKILGIDPSVNKLGWGVIDISKNVYIASGTLCTNPAESLCARLGKLSKKIEEFIELYTPSTIALETMFLKKDIYASLKLNYVRGIVMSIIGKKDLQLIEVAPAHVKKNVTGSGRAAKAQVKKMIGNIIPIPANIKISTFDEADALAIAYSASLNLVSKQLCEL